MHENTFRQGSTLIPISMMVIDTDDDDDRSGSAFIWRIIEMHVNTLSVISEELTKAATRRWPLASCTVVHERPS